MRKIKGSEARSAWIFLTPSLLLYGTYVLMPILFSFYLSITDWDGISSFPNPICLKDSSRSCFENYYTLLDDDVFWISLKNNILWLLFFSASPLLGLGIAFLLHTKGGLTRLYKTLFFMPMVFSLVVVGMVWGWFFQPEFGLIDHLLHILGVLSPEDHFGMITSFDWPSTIAVIIAASWPHVAYCMILFLAGISNLKKGPIDAARIDGANRWQLFWHIILPMLKPATIMVVIVTAIGALRAFDVIAIMTAGGPANSTNTLANYMYQQTFQAFKYGYGASIATVLFAISVILILTYLKQAQRSR